MLYFRFLTSILDIRHNDRLQSDVNEATFKVLYNALTVTKIKCIGATRGYLLSLRF